MVHIVIDLEMNPVSKSFKDVRKFTADEDYVENEIRRSGPATLMFALTPECITGKLVNEA